MVAFFSDGLGGRSRIPIISRRLERTCGAMDNSRLILTDRPENLRLFLDFVQK